MTSRVPPHVAAWLLRRVRKDETSDALVGDLIEEYQTGRSATWYWKQTVAILALGLVADFRNHTLLAIRATLFGGALLWLFGVAERPLIALAFNWLVLETGWMTRSGWGAPFAYYLAPLWCLTGVCAGWIIGRTHQSIWALSVILAAVVQVLWNASWTWTLVVSSIDHERYWPYLAATLGFQLILVLSLLAGGLLSAQSGEKAHPRGFVVDN